MDCNHLDQKWLNHCDRRLSLDRHVSYHPRECVTVPSLWWAHLCLLGFDSISTAPVLALLTSLLSPQSMQNVCLLKQPGCSVVVLVVPSRRSTWRRCMGDRSSAASHLLCFSSQCRLLLVNPIWACWFLPTVLTVGDPCHMHLLGQWRCDHTLMAWGNTGHLEAMLGACS